VYHVEQQRGIAESQLRDYQASLGKPFLHDEYLAALTALRDGLKAGLSGGNREAGTEMQPSVSALAEQVKALKAANALGWQRTRRQAAILRGGTGHHAHPEADGGDCRSNRGCPGNMKRRRIGARRR